MSGSLRDLQDLRTILGRLNAERPAGLGNSPGHTRYQMRSNDFFRRLNLEVDSRQGKARILLTGQIGVGKSSELWHYFEEKRRETHPGFWVFCDLEKGEHPERCGATGVFLTIFRDCWSETRRFQTGQQELMRIRDEIFTRMVDWLKGEPTEDNDKVIFRFGGMDFPLFFHDKNKALALLLVKATQHEAVSHPSERFGIVPDSLINLLNKLLDWLTKRCRGRAPVLIVDHVDKIRNHEAAREVLLEAVPQWNRIVASIIMTAPYEYTLGELRNSIESYWDMPLMVYPLQTPSLNGGEIPEIYWEIVQSAGLEGLIEEEALRILAFYSGGVLRSFVQFLIQACKQAHLADHDVVEESDARNVKNEAERAYQDFNPADLQLLDQIARTGTGLREAATLLRSPVGLLVSEPSSGEQLLRVHPLARTALDRYLERCEREPA